MKRFRNIFFFALLLPLLGGMLLMPDVSFAQQEQLEQVNAVAGLGNEDIRIVIASIINIVLSFLGIIAVIIVIYGGFVWMTAAGDAEKVERAKKILISGVIGLTIILLSWAITSFVLTSLINATGAGGGGTSDDLDNIVNLGGSNSTSFAIAGVTPQGAIPIRNVVIQATFSRNLDPTTVDGDTFVVREVATGTAVPGDLAVSGNRISFTPTAACPSPNETRKCFTENTEFEISIAVDIESEGGLFLSQCTPTCLYTFTTGDVVDVANPTASITVPENNDLFPSGELVAVQVQATDDYQVGTGSFTVQDTLFDSLVATGDDLANVTISTTWDTVEPVATVVGDRYTLEVTVTDLAGNTDSDSVSVKASPAYCFKGDLDSSEIPPEEGIDCGGLCGACDGGSCTDDSQCAGSCVNGICTSLPTITDISPKDGAPGTFVTITGTSFGFADGTVSFVSSSGGLVEASMPACSDGWSGTQIVVEVPATAADGAITLETSTGLIDVSNDANGPSVEDFDVNTSVRPNLCKLSPNTGGVGNSLSVIGNSFGVLEDAITFTSGTSSEEVRTFNAWTDSTIDAIVPALDEKPYDVAVEVGGVSSNTLRFNVVEPISDAPFISTIDPPDGGVGQYITLSGDHFGSSAGVVWFENQTDGVATIADTVFPAACAAGNWTDDEVTVKVPDVSSDGYNIYVEQGNQESNRVSFSVTTAAAGPGICAILPAEGGTGDVVTVIGEHFGSSNGTTTFYNEAVSNVTSWSDQQVVTTVPSSAQSGPFSITSTAGVESNNVSFDVTTVVADVGVQGAAYVWNFSTGEIPITPHIVVACTETDISAVPNAVFTPEVCVNAIGFAHFDTLMDESTLNGNTILFDRCENPDCSVRTNLNPIITASSSSTQTSFSIYPQQASGRLDPSTTYLITVTTGVESLSGIPMENEVTWDFTTSASTADCDIDSVRVSPQVEFLTEEGETTEFNALPMSGECVILNGEDYAWSWDIDTSIASINEGCVQQSGDSCATVEALLEGETPVEATSTDSGVSGEADLTINFTDPYVDNYWPNCDTACVNADVGAGFNIPMTESLIEQPGSVVLYECDNEFCFNLNEVVDDSATCVDEGAGCTAISMGLTANLKMQTWYRVIISGTVTSLSDVPLTRPNYGNDFSWTFLTREDSTECAVSSIELEPQMSTLHVVGERQPYTAVPFGEPDSCSVAGQRLNGFEHAWNWTNPIDNTSTEDKNIASWVEINGSLFDSNPQAVPDGCTSSCTPEGSQPILAVCGNGGAPQIGEDCDDGNTLDGDGCSAICLNEGTDACSRVCSTSGLACAQNSDCDTAAGEVCEANGFGCCGDAIVNAGEECDDGDVRSGDGCSSICLNEGSQAADLTCGDGIVTYDPGIGGEECEDGDTSNGDGCSSVCLHEGSLGLSDVPAICGNGTVQAPYETCDDGNIGSGDGCSSRCLREGAAASAVTGFVCGDGIVNRAGSGAGEDCDTGEGCSAQCLFMGSSLTYSSPSICGNGLFETGEFLACENAITGDGELDPIQMAEIDDDAAAEVDETGEATQVIEVSLDDLSVDAELTLLCTAETDADCPAGFGVDTNGCCSARPNVSLFPNSTNACLNAAIYMISDKEMNVGSFTGNAYVLYSGTGACPAGHTTFTTTASADSWLARVWHSIRSVFVGIVNAQESGDCIVPIQSFTQSQISESPDQFKIDFNTNVLLDDLIGYMIVVEGGPDGVLTSTGVALPSTVTQKFKTGTEICTLDKVGIDDLTGEVDGLFTRFDDDHDMVASPYTLRGGVQEEIQEVPGVYEWNWLAWQEDSGGVLFTVTVPNAAAPEASTVSPVGDNGEAILIAQAQIVGSGTCSVAGESCSVSTDCPTIVGETNICEFQTVTGTLDLVALLCETPWPAPALFPFEDTQEGSDRGIPGLSPDPAWMNFSSYYCRDTSDPAAPLSELAVVSAIDPGTEAVIKEYFLAVGDTSDVIGIRIATNPEYLSPLAWYEDQGFSGNPSDRTVDGFEAITDGRTTYVSAPNEDEINGVLYSNIYVLSYNQGASDETVSIYNQLLNNWSFIVNINSTNLCQAGGAFTGTVCTSDFDCTGVGEVCASLKDKIQRDTKRLADMTTIASTVEEYGNANRLCSATSTQSCTTSADCPAGEACLASYPTLPSGSFVRSITSSIWSSWNDNLVSLVGTLPTDPLNRYAECGPDSDNPGFDATTCVNQTLGEYICPEKSYTYHYRSQGPFGYQVTSDLEYLSQAASAWISDIDTNTTNDLEITVGKAALGAGAGFITSSAFCDGTTYGNSNICGDGIVGTAEACEVGQGGTGTACDSNGDGVDDGYQPTVCNASCTGFATSATTACVPYSCGNGVLEGGETCDDGSLNGDYGFCNYDCSGFDFFCGDGTIAGGEVCDCGTTIIGGLTVGGGACSALNGVYRSNPNNSCAWDCGGSSSFCGDGIIDSGESCDGDLDTWSGQLCRTNPNKGMPCSSNADCGAGGLCGQGGTLREWAADCPISAVCIGGADDGLACATSADCTGGTCSTFTVQTQRTRTCSDDGAAGQLCTWTQATWQNIDCKAPGSCGNGIEDPGEECDDGNTNETDSCTNVCTDNVCGDGFLYQGVEQCDEGSDNGLVCSSSYESTCSYCSSSCRLLASSGSFCGDGQINGGEFCDAGDMPYYWAQGYGGGDYDLNGTCDASQEGDFSGYYRCQRMGVCSGGDDSAVSEVGNSRNGYVCQGSSDCFGGVCVFPTCNDSCTSSCPYTYDNVQIQLLDNQVGAIRSSSANLLSTTETEDATILGDPNAATVYVTSCSVIESLVMDLDDTNRQYPDVDIMFVLDLSQTMDSVMDSGETRLEVLQTAVSDAAATLFEEYAGVSGASMRIGLAYIGNAHGTDTNGDGEYQSSELYNFAGVDSRAPGGFAGMAPSGSQATVEAAINTLLVSVAPDVGTPVYESLKDARDAFDGTADVEYVVVFTDGVINYISADYSKLTHALIGGGDTDGDGAVDSDEYMRAVTGLTNNMKNAREMQIFTAVLEASSCNDKQMQKWSSNSCSADANGCFGMSVEGNYECDIGDDGIDYAYTAETASELEAMYEAIVDAILNITVSLTYDGQTKGTTVDAQVGTQVGLPSSFVCDGSEEQEIFLRLSFNDKGEGTVGVSNIRANMCSE